MDQYKLLEPINCGRYGGVYKAVNKHNKVVAIKKLPLCRHDMNHFENVTMIQRESTHWSKVTGKPNVVPLIDYIHGTEEAWFISEYCHKGSLHDNLTHLYGDYNRINYTLKNILKGINSCHEENIAHCDIKPANILLANNNEWKLCDFGCSQTTEFNFSGLFIKKGTPIFIAPELFWFDGYGKNVDIWAIGVIGYMLAHNGEYPFTWDANFKHHIMEGSFKWINTNTSKEYQDLVKLCLNPDHKQRITSSEALTHPLFK